MASASSSKGGMGFKGATGSSNSNSAIMIWIKANGKVVPNSKWKASTTTS